MPPREEELIERSPTLPQTPAEMQVFSEGLSGAQIVGAHLQFPVGGPQGYKHPAWVGLKPREDSKSALESPRF